MTHAEEHALDPDALYRVVHARRDVRTGYRPDPIGADVLTRVLAAAHAAPSVGFSQPWDFLVIRDADRRARVQRLAAVQRERYAANLPAARRAALAGIKTEAILQTPVNIAVTCDPTRGGRHTLGRYTQPRMAPYSTALAVENLWLAARAEGLGVGWVSFFDERELAAELHLPRHVEVVAYLCLGWVSQFPAEPELALAGWARRRPLAWAIHDEEYGRRALPGEEPVDLIAATIAAIVPADATAAAAARQRQDLLTKPRGALGALEAVSVRLSAMASAVPPPVPEPAVVAVFAADHGVHAQHVTPWPQEVTAQMVGNFLAGGAAINALARQAGVEVCVVDVGVATPLVDAPGLLPRRIRDGSADLSQGPALSAEEVRRAVEVGVEVARDLVTAGNRCLLTGDMGIANTTASACLIAAFTGADAATVTGRGTGVDTATWEHKVDVVRAALTLHQPDPGDPLAVLAGFGGLEHAALVGFCLAGAALRVPVVLDGVISVAAALAARALCPAAVDYWIAGHRSAEPGAGIGLAALGLEPLLELGLRLGEGTGAVLAFPVVAAAARALAEMATFDAAGVTDKDSSRRGPG